jgi:hypothetical protein
MIDAIIGSIIAVIATGALALMAEVFTLSQESVVQRDLSDYEQSVLNLVSSAQKRTPVPSQEVSDWLKAQYEVGRESWREIQ